MSELSHKQKVAIIALANGDTHEIAAQKANVARETISRWIHADDSTFRDALKDASDTLLNSIIHQMSACLADAVFVLRSITNDSEASYTHRINAASRLAHIALSVREQHLLTERIENLEAQLQGIEASK